MSHEQPSLPPGPADSMPFGCVAAPDGAGVTRLTLTGELDLATAPELRAALDRAAEDAELVIVDLSALSFIDSSGLCTIVTADARLRDANRRLALIPGERQVKRIFELTGLADRLPFTSDVTLSRNGHTPLPQPDPPAGANIAA